jgi:hypothetical protein
VTGDDGKEFILVIHSAVAQAEVRAPRADRILAIERTIASCGFAQDKIHHAAQTRHQHRLRRHLVIMHAARQRLAMLTPENEKRTGRLVAVQAAPHTCLAFLTAARFCGYMRHCVNADAIPPIPGDGAPR